MKFLGSDSFEPNSKQRKQLQKLRSTAAGDYCIEFWTKFGNFDRSVLVRKKRGPGGKHLDTKQANTKKRRRENQVSKNKKIRAAQYYSASKNELSNRIKMLY